MKLFNLSFILGVSFTFFISSMVYLFFIGAPVLLSLEMTSVSSTSADLIVVVDRLSVTFVSLVMFISTVVMLYSQGYMKEDVNKNRLSGLLTLFIVSMVVFIVTPNVMTMLLGWDGLGIISFALVLFYNSHSSSGAAMITVLTNRIGDILILCSVGMMLGMGHWDLAGLSNFSESTLCLMLLVASCTKSAQFPFSAWLPQAMAAPTPVSALVHSSTLVTAGVYLMVRLSGDFNPCSSWLSLILILSSVTSVMAGACALVEKDLKKMVALSTLSQLGTMALGVSLGAPMLSFFHLVTHALSKSLLFICVGSFISSNQGSQDTRNLKNNLWAMAPLSYVGCLLSSLSLCGAPFVSGFYSKDLILESLWESPVSILAIMSGAFSTALTSGYSVKLLSLCSEATSSTESNPVRLKKTEEEVETKISVFFLFFATLFGGYMLSKMWGGFYTPLLLSGGHKYLAMFMLLGGFFMAQMEEKNLIAAVFLTPYIHHFLHSMFFLEYVTSQWVVGSAKDPLYATYKSLEQGWVESLISGAVNQVLMCVLKLNYQLATVLSPMYLAYAGGVWVLMSVVFKDSCFFG